MKMVVVIILLIALAGLAAVTVAVPLASRDLIRVGPFTAWNSAQGDPSHSSFRATAFVRAPLASVLSRVRLLRIAVDVDIYDAAGGWLGHASGVDPIRLVADDYPQQPAGFASVAGIDAFWGQPVPGGPIQRPNSDTPSPWLARGRSASATTRLGSPRPSAADQRDGQTMAGPATACTRPATGVRKRGGRVDPRAPTADCPQAKHSLALRAKLCFTGQRSV